MGSLGNQTFIGAPGLHPDVIRRLDDLVRLVSQNATDLQTSKKTALSASQVQQISFITTQQALQSPGTVINITNAIGTAAQAQPSLIPIVSVLPNPLVTPLTIGQAVSYKGSIWIWNGTAWVQSTLVLQDTEANFIANYPASSYGSGTLFWKTDKEILLLNQILGPASNWTPIASQTVIDTHANRIANYKSVDYPRGTPFYEINRTVTYLSRDAVGTVNTLTAANAVAWVSGDQFDTAWVGYPITINGAVYYWATITSPTAGTLTTDPGNQTGVAFTQASGLWFYDNGEMIGTLAQLPSGLGAKDLNFRFGCTDEGEHSFRWNGSGWQFAPGDPGSGWFCEGVQSPEPASCWELVTSGGTGTYTLPAGITTSYGFPTFLGADGLAFKRSGSVYNGTPTAATPSSTGNEFGSGIAVQSGSGTTVAEHPHFHPTVPPNDANGGILTNITLPNWMRK